MTQDLKPGLSPELRPRFGDIIENGWASEDSPIRVGFFVREGRRTGRMNPGRYFEVTNGNGRLWEVPVDRDHKITVRTPTPEPQAEVRGLVEALLQANAERTFEGGWVILQSAVETFLASINSHQGEK